MHRESKSIVNGVDIHNYGRKRRRVLEVPPSLTQIEQVEI